jgi:hypothetical protein
MEDPDTVILAAMAAMLIVALGCGFIARTANRSSNSDDPQIVLRRCRLELDLVRQELERIPASRDVMQQLDRTYRQIDITDKALARSERKAG